MVGNIALNDSRFKYDRKGFASIFNTIIDLSRLHFNLYNNYNVWVDDKQVLELFENINKFEANVETYNVSDVFFNLLEKGQYSNTYHAHTIANEEDLKSRRIHNVLRFKPNIIKEFELLKEQLFNNKKILGVQIRGTDKKIEIPEIDVDWVCRLIDETLIKEQGFDKVFVATDDWKYLNKLIKNYGDGFVLYNKNNLISYNQMPIHFDNDKTLLNYQVTSDCYLLSKTDYFLYCFSNVSLLALTLRTNFTNKIRNINK